MYRAKDINRDQSYFLFSTSQEQLNFLRFPLGEIEGVGSSYPGRALDYAIETGMITQAEGKKIWHKNVLNWLGVKSPNLSNLKH